ncbi:MAG: hypothetical protein JWR77_2652 [Rhizorhabdus sp.]|nr:hypothetical protein [Rhizorhabdus sp.]
MRALPRDNTRFASVGPHVGPQASVATIPQSASEISAACFIAYGALNAL